MKGKKRNFFDFPVKIQGFSVFGKVWLMKGRRKWTVDYNEGQIFHKNGGSVLTATKKRFDTCVKDIDIDDMGS